MGPLLADMQLVPGVGFIAMLRCGRQSPLLQSRGFWIIVAGACSSWRSSFAEGVVAGDGSGGLQHLAAIRCDMFELERMGLYKGSRFAMTFVFRRCYRTMCFHLACFI
jgi:hypothetical protein